MTDEPEILFEVRDGLALVTLNRPKALNALTFDMVLALDARLAAWAMDDAVWAVMLQGAGDRAFCAGGDIRAMYDDRAADGDLRDRFYWHEYRLNRRIHRFPKPYIALADGVTMGGGVGVSEHGSHRVVTERTLYAMPETGIGLFPDVGGSYFLPRLADSLGPYLGLTGARLRAADCRAAGLADIYIPSEALPAAIDALVAAERSHAGVDAVLQRFAEDPGPPPLAAHRDAIARCFGAGTPEAILTAVAAEDSDWARETAATLATKSPTSLKLTAEALRRGAALSVEDCIVMEYRLARRCMAGHDFFEGVRAVLVDKDNAPAWQPATLEAVTEAHVQAYFAPLDPELVFD